MVGTRPATVMGHRDGPASSPGGHLTVPEGSGDDVGVNRALSCHIQAWCRGRHTDRLPRGGADARVALSCWLWPLVYGLCS